MLSFLKILYPATWGCLTGIHSSATSVRDDLIFKPFMVGRDGSNLRFEKLSEGMESFGILSFLNPKFFPSHPLNKSIKPLNNSVAIKCLI